MALPEGLVYSSFGQAINTLSQLHGQANSRDVGDVLEGIPTGGPNSVQFQTFQTGRLDTVGCRYQGSGDSNAKWQSWQKPWDQDRTSQYMALRQLRRGEGWEGDRETRKSCVCWCVRDV